MSFPSLSLQERYIILALSLLAIVVPSMVLSAPTLLDQLMELNAADQQDQAFNEAVASLEKREAGAYDGGEALTQQIRERRSTSVNRCVMDCWLCIQTMHRGSIKLGDCIAGCAGLSSTKMLTNPLEAQSWSRCRTDFIQS